MTEKSYMWTTGGGLGDGAASYTQADWSDLFRVVGACMDDEGVAPAYLNALVPSTTGANNARIGTGGGICDGKPYYNSAAVDVTIPSASGGGNTRIDRVVLRANWATATVRVTRIAGTDAASPTAPAITQNTGVVYDIKLCQALVNTSGTVSITDERVFAKVGSANGLADGIVTTDKILDSNVTYAKLGSVTGPAIVGRTAASVGVLAGIAIATAGEMPRNVAGVLDVVNGVPQLYRRQGGSASDWTSIGTSTQTPTAVRMQAGGIATDASGNATVTFPVAFSDKPIAFLTGVSGGGTPADVYVVSTSTTQLVIKSSNNLVNVYWFAIGPE